VLDHRGRAQRGAPDLVAAAHRQLPVVDVSPGQRPGKRARESAQSPSEMAPDPDGEPEGGQQGQRADRERDHGGLRLEGGEALVGRRAVRLARSMKPPMASVTPSAALSTELETSPWLRRDPRGEPLRTAQRPPA
jgi:hypothetical protein